MAGEWYLTLGSGHNQIKIILTTLNEIFSYIQRILLCGIFNFRIPRMLEAFRGVFDEQLPILDAKESSDRVFCTTNRSGHKHYGINLMV